MLYRLAEMLKTHRQRVTEQSRLPGKKYLRFSRSVNPPMRPVAETKGYPAAAQWVLTPAGVQLNLPAQLKSLPEPAKQLLAAKPVNIKM
jgi:hypothetical protein